jgi:hypothetical protein
MTKAGQIRDCIYHLAQYFRSETANFRSEGNFQCILFAQLRKETRHSRIDGMELVHAEFPTATNIKHVGYYDLAILTPSAAHVFKELYYRGRPVGEWRDVMEMSAVIEIKFGSQCPGADDNEIRKDIRRLKEVLRKNIARHAYFLLFLDKDVEWEENNYKTLCRRFERDTKAKTSSRLEIYCIPGKGGDMLRLKQGKVEHIALV